MADILYDAIMQDVDLTQKYLETLFPNIDEDYKALIESMKYSLFSTGKRVRPFLTIEFAKLFGSDADSALPFACSVELIHTYSLIHDDLPCMDNDDLRRGKPTNHKVFGESTALLAGDALLTLAFGCAACGKNEKSVCFAVSLLSGCAGYNGMIAGQQMDIIGEWQKYDLNKLVKTHSLKTGKLITCACLLGAASAGFFEGSDEYKAALKYSQGVGLAFQITDDILDAYGDESSLGKTVGSDAQSGKSTFLSLMTRSEAEEYAKRITDEAKDAIKDYDGNDILLRFADNMLTRIK